MKLFILIISAFLLAGCSFANNQIEPSELAEVEKAVELEIQTIAAQAAVQSVVDSTARAPTATPLPPAAPILPPAPALRLTPTPLPKQAPTPTREPTPTRTPQPTPTPVPLVLNQAYKSADGVMVTLNSLSVIEAGNATTVSISYTLLNATEDPQEEKAWKLFFQGTGGLYFGFHGELTQNQSIDRNFTFSAVAPNGLLVLAYPSEFSDSSWDQDDLIWNVTQLLIN